LIHVPSLDQRKEDIPILANYFIEQLCGEYGQQLKEITPEALEMLASRSWSGNIREFRNVIERLIILGGNTIGVEDINSFVG
jgi:two-component system, NtrC family, nitrogen regulation response regulator NtrX